MYLQHWKLSHSPFASRYAVRNYFASPMGEEALARLHFLVDDGRRVGLLLGPHGSGKSVSLEVLRRERIRAGGTAVTLSLLGMDEQETLWRLTAALGLNPAAEATRVALWRSVLDFLAIQRHEQRATALLFDDVQEAAPEVQAMLWRLLDWDQTPESRLTLVLAVVPEFLPRLGRRAVDLAELRVTLEPWEIADTTAFLRHMFEKAGNNAELFSPAAVERLQALSAGNPRRLCQLANLALLAGAGQGLSQIGPETLQGVCDELVVPAIPEPL